MLQADCMRIRTVNKLQTQKQGMVGGGLNGKRQCNHTRKINTPCSLVSFLLTAHNR